MPSAFFSQEKVTNIKIKAGSSHYPKMVNTSVKIELKAGTTS
jgi:hypothetical protein